MEVAVADRVLSYEQGGDSTFLVATPMPKRDTWAAYIEAALVNLESQLRVVFPTGDTHTAGLFPQGIRARYKDREFSLWCDEPGELILVHESLRAQHVERLCAALSDAY